MSVSTDSNHYSTLLEVLELQIKTYRSLLNVVRKEKEILISSEIDDLSKNNAKKEDVLLKLRSLEIDRTNKSSTLAKSLQLDPNSCRLMDFSRHYQTESPEVSQRLESIHNVLNILLKRIKVYGEQNEKLVNSALNHITGAMRAIKDTLNDKPSYQRDGDCSTSSQSGRLVSREI